ncbi:citrate synthase [bacterium]|nr:citrate synthase [bacterium]
MKNKLEGFIKKEYKDSLKLSNIDNVLYDQYNVKKGLRNANGTGVLVLLTKISDVYGYKMVDNKKIDDEGHLYYRGYDIYDLAKLNELKFGYERVCFLILFSRLPSEEEIVEFHNILSEEYELPKNFATDVLFRNNSPSVMNQIQRSILSLYSYDDNPDATDPYDVLMKGIRIIAKLPAIVSYCYRCKRHYVDGLSLHIREPKDEYSLAQNLLYMSRTNGKFTQLEAETLDLALILHADHGGANNSTFANIVVSSTQTDIYSSIVASLGSLKGPRHGGASRAVRDMMGAVIKEIGLTASEDKIRKVVKKILNKDFFDESGLIYGIGHAVYTLSDPRAVLLKEKCHSLAIMNNELERYEFYDKFEKIAHEELKNLKGEDFHTCTNVDFYSGLTYEILKINEDLYIPLFACARTVGWLAHNIENKLYCDKIVRPAGKYIGDIKKGLD